MKITKAIVAVDDNPLFNECWNLIAKGWRNIGGIETIIVSVGNQNIKCQDAQIIHFNSIPGIPNSFVAQVIRFIIPVYFQEDVCILSDIDMLPLSKKYFVDDLKKYDSESLVVLSSDAYKVDDKFPICYFASKGKNYQKLIELHDTSINGIKNFIIELYNLKLGWVTDEMFLGKCIKENKANVEIHLLCRCSKFPFHYSRIDRSNWRINKIRLVKNNYIDAHLLRPINQYQKELELLFLYIKYNNNGYKSLIMFILKFVTKTR
jgi:hypothetical protein